MQGIDYGRSLGLKNRIAIVTGAANGIGLATARMFLAAGVKVLATDVDGAALACEYEDVGSNNLKLLTADLSKTEAAGTIVAETVEAFGGLHILVNCAGFIRRMPLEDVDEDVWGRIMDINLRGQFFLSRQAASVMKDARWGRIICFSSLAGETGGLAESAAYAISKGGVLTMVKSLAREYARRKITVNCIAPGIVRTRMITDTLSDETQKELVQSIPLGRMTEPDEIAQAVLFLTSDWSATVTGHVLDINGGMLMR
jgi:3-oxoacyl-[acyl-carrier protein] reductase